MAITFTPGEAWSYRVVAPYEGSRIIVGAVFSFAERDVVCCAVTGAPRRRPDGSIDVTTIPFLPMAADALAASVIASEGPQPLPEGFVAGLDQWQADPRGLSIFTVPFEGFLDHLIARQMAAILGVDEAQPATAEA